MTSLRGLVAVALLCSISPAFAEEAGPATTLDPNLPTYRSVRESMLSEGWKPDAGYGLKLANGRPAYRFPEVVCGPQVCAGKWRKGSEERKISILRGDGKEEYRVGPQ